MEKLITRKEAAKLLGISLATLDEARNSGLISYIQYVPNGCVYFTSAYTIEGNSGDSCRQNSYPVGYYEIYGYGIPAY